MAMAHPILPPPGYVLYGNAHVHSHWIKANDRDFWARVARESQATVVSDIPRRHVTLSKRQTEVLTLAAGGMTNLGIALRLVISETTVRQHLGTVYHSIGVTRRSEAVRWFKEQAT